MDPSASALYTIQQVQIGTSSGSCNVTFSINGTPITGLAAIAVTSTPAYFTATGANIVAPGAILTVTINSTSSGNNLSATLLVQ